MKIMLLVLMLWNTPILVGAQTNNFSIEFNLKGADDSSKVLLLRFKDLDGWDRRFEPLLFDTIAITTMQNGRLKFSDEIDTDGKPYAIALNGSRRILLMLPAKLEKITVNSELSKWPQADVAGSKGTSDMLEYQRTFAPLNDRKKMTEVAVFRDSFLKSHPNSFYSAFVILMNKEMSADERIKAFEDLTPYVKSSFFGKKLVYAMENNMLVQIREKEVGSVIPDFAIRGTDGRVHSVRQIVRQSKYTLIDFWASWCAPCINDIAKLKETYDAFHHQSFNIIGVSTDKKKADWERALKEHPTPWIHGLDDVEHASKIIFGLYAIPGYILVDQHGRILRTSYFTEPGMKNIGLGEKSLSGNLFEIIEGLMKSTEL
jgi:peroxiredoxin